jgi:hypothetical protein
VTTKTARKNVTPELLAKMIDGLEKTSGKAVDLIVVGSNDIEQQVLESLEALGIETITVICDHEYPARMIHYGSSEDLPKLNRELGLDHLLR